MLTPLLITSIITGESVRNPPWRWDFPAECPDHHELRRRIQREHGGRPATNLEVSASIAREPDGYHLSGEVTLNGRRQPVTLYGGNTCETLVELFADYLAPMLPDPEPKATPPVAARRLNGYIRAAGEVDIWTLCPGSTCEISPLPTWGGAFGGGWIHPRVRVELTFPLHTATSRAAQLDTPTGTFGDMTTRWIRTGARFRVCRALERSRFELLLCGELGLQLLFGLPHSDSIDFKATTPVLAWGTVRLAPAFVWWMHPRAGLRLEIAPGVNLHPNHYQVYDRIKGENNRRPLAEIAWFHTVVGMGLDVRLGRRPGT